MGSKATNQEQTFRSGTGTSSSLRPNTNFLNSDSVVSALSLEVSTGPRLARIRRQAEANAANGANRANESRDPATLSTGPSNRNESSREPRQR
eukprot:Skav209096  [mRNA]  locus=scaffold179:31671:31949:+ [translate_table: standard]